MFHTHRIAVVTEVAEYSHLFNESGDVLFYHLAGSGLGLLGRSHRSEAKALAAVEAVAVGESGGHDSNEYLATVEMNVVGQLGEVVAHAGVAVVETLHANHVRIKVAFALVGIIPFG